MKTPNELMEILGHEIDNVRLNKTTPQKVNAICNATGKMIGLTRLQMDYNKLTGVKTKLHWLSSDVNGKIKLK